MAKSTLPSHFRFLVGSLIGAIGSSVVISPFAVFIFGFHGLHWWNSFVLSIIFAPIIFVVIIIVAWPLFCVSRGVSWFHLKIALGIGATVGALIGAAIPILAPWRSACLMAVGGIVAAGLTWWWTFRYAQRMSSPDQYRGPINHRLPDRESHSDRNQ